MTDERDELLSVARAAVDVGSKMLSTAERGVVRAKGDRDFVTDLDQRIQDLMREQLERATPGIGFVGEESSADNVDPGDAFWALDPIDGTSNFIHGLPLCAVSLALVEHGEPVIGVVRAPFLNLEYYGVDGFGAFANERRISVSDTETIGGAIVSLGDYAVGVGAVGRNQRRFAITAALAENVERVRMFGSAALDLAWVAEGRTDACVIMSNKPWDTAAGVLLARESGAIVSDSGGQRHSFGSHDTIAATPAIAERLVTLLNRCSEPGWGPPGSSN